MTLQITGAGTGGLSAHEQAVERIWLTGFQRQVGWPGLALGVPQGAQAWLHHPTMLRMGLLLLVQLLRLGLLQMGLLLLLVLWLVLVLW